MDDITTELVLLAGGDPFAAVRSASESHRCAYRCGLYSAGSEVMQLAASYVRAANAVTVLDLGSGLGYSTLWFAAAVGRSGSVIGVDWDPTHVEIAERLVVDAGFGDRVTFIAGDVADVLSGLHGTFDAIHDDAWFAGAPDHLETMLELLSPGGLLTMPNWFLLVDALTGKHRNDWEAFGGPTWVQDTKRYAEMLADRTDVAVNWITQPPLGVLIKHRH